MHKKVENLTSIKIIVALMEICKMKYVMKEYQLW